MSGSLPRLCQREYPIMTRTPAINVDTGRICARMKGDYRSSITYGIEYSNTNCMQKSTQDLTDSTRLLPYRVSCAGKLRFKSGTRVQYERQQLASCGATQRSNTYLQNAIIRYQPCVGQHPFYPLVHGTHLEASACVVACLYSIRCRKGG